MNHGLLLPHVNNEMVKELQAEGVSFAKVRAPWEDHQSGANARATHDQLRKDSRTNSGRDGTHNQFNFALRAVTRPLGSMSSQSICAPYVQAFS